MDNNKLNRILDMMREEGLPQMIISDPVSIFYLTGAHIHPGERLLALYLNVNGGHKIMINRLFPQSKDLGVDIIWYEDTDKKVEMLNDLIDHNAALGIDKTWPAHFLLDLQDMKAAPEYRNGSLIVDRVRQIKDEGEKELLRESSRINDKVISEIIPLVTKGYTELELDAIVRDTYKKYGCEGVSFDPITAYAGNAADPHHETDESTGKIGDCVVIDIGGMKDNYASDMTRTVFIGEVSDRAREVYEVVREAQQRGIDAAKPGNRMMDVDLACRNYIEEKGFGKYFTHRTGHSCGLEDHEWGDVSAVNDAIIKPGQCFSIEPGIYIAEENIGVRIEDLVLITEDGCEVLNKVTKELIVVPVE